jgi:hypothetical protein
VLEAEASFPPAEAAAALVALLSPAEAEPPAEADPFPAVAAAALDEDDPVLELLPELPDPELLPDPADELPDAPAPAETPPTDAAAAAADEADDDEDELEVEAKLGVAFTANTALTPKTAITPAKINLFIFPPIIGLLRFDLSQDGLIYFHQIN